MFYLKAGFVINNCEILYCIVLSFKYKTLFTGCWKGRFNSQLQIELLASFFAVPDRDAWLCVRTLSVRPGQEC